MEGCVKPPKGSPTDYDYAHVGETITSDGETIKTAVIAGGIPHPNDQVPADMVPNIYANTGHQVMRVRYGQDNNGLWFAGALFPNLDEHEVATIRASALSGDWRWQAQYRKTGGGAYDFSGAIMVNIPGYRVEADGLGAGRSETIMASSNPTKDNMATEETHEPIIAGGESCGGGCGCGGDKKQEAPAEDTTNNEQLASLIAAAVVKALDEREQTVTAASDGDGDGGGGGADTDGPVEEPADTEAAVTLEKLAGMITDVSTQIAGLEESLIIQPALDQLASEFAE
jgi:hypothetical protein